MRKAILDENKRVVRLEQITETHKRNMQKFLKEPKRVNSLERWVCK